MKNKTPFSGTPAASSAGAKPKKTAGATSPSAPSAPVAPPIPPRPLTHEEISARARQIWEQRGRPEGQDQSIWHEAERQLRSSELRSTEEGRFSNPREILDRDGDPNDEIDRRLDEIASPGSSRSATSL